jgi:hypothetical protein
MRAALTLVIALAALTTAAGAQAATPPAASCASLARHACVLLQPSSVMRSGVTHSVPWVLVRGGAPRVKPGGTIVIGTGSKDADGFAGVVIGIKRRGNVTAIAAVPALPSPSTVKAMASGSVSAFARAASPQAGGSSPLSLIPPSLLEKLNGSLLQLSCTSGPAFPLQVTGLSIDPNSASATLTPGKSGAPPSALNLAFQVSPAFTASLGLKDKLACSASQELAAATTPFAVAGVPGLLRTSGEVSGQVALEGTASGSAKIGFTTGANVTVTGRGVTVNGANVSGIAEAKDPFTVRANGSVQLKATAVARILIYGFWGPRISLAWGPEVKLAAVNTDPSTAPENTCSNLTLSLPITLSAGVGFQPGVYAGSNAALRAISEAFGGKWVSGLAQSSLPITVPGGSPILLPTREFKTVWRLDKAIDSGDLYSQDFKPIADMDFPTIGNAATSASCQPRLTSASFKVSGATLHYINLTPAGDMGCVVHDDTVDSGMGWDSEWDSTIDRDGQGQGPVPLVAGQYATTPRINANGVVNVTHSLTGPCSGAPPPCSGVFSLPSGDGPEFSYYKVTAVNGDGAARTYAIHVNAILGSSGFLEGCPTEFERSFGSQITNTDVLLQASGATPSGPRSQTFPVTVSRTLTDGGFSVDEEWSGTVTLNGYW